MLFPRDGVLLRGPHVGGNCLTCAHSESDLSETRLLPTLLVLLTCCLLLEDFSSPRIALGGARIAHGLEVCIYLSVHACRPTLPIYTQYG